MLTKAKELQWIQGFQVGSDPSTTLTVPHLLYADDTLIFCGADSQQIRNLNITLMVFEFIFGLHINMLKNIIYLVDEVSNLEELADILSCKIGSFPTTYLGLPLGEYLSFGGRLTLINSVLDNIPTYCMSLFPLPRLVRKKIDRLRRRFMWEGNSQTHKFSLW
ncbi:hypothetical protein AABB24_009384 [Solanum stoloniferum]|uniref:Uncharacterized protein n=2 Tax=Solanum TaxID=4107 RepID=A0AAF0QYP4_SOLVR|nr:hypothetical protein MTR67_022301 [Solanum verrucosum]